MEYVRLAQGSHENPLALLIADLIRQNIAQNPAKLESLRALDITARLRASDLDSEVTLEFGAHRGLSVHAVNSLPSQVTIVADSETILDLARLSIHRPTGVPVLWDSVGRSIVRRFFQKRLSIQPLGRYLGKLSRMLAVLSVSS